MIIMTDIHMQTLKNINDFLTEEGLKRKRIAKKLEMSESNLSDYLNGKRTNIHDFAIRLAKALKLDETYFINTNYEPLSSHAKEQSIAFSAGILSKEGTEGLEQIFRICDLIDTYNFGENRNA